MVKNQKAKFTLTDSACKGSEGVNVQPERPGGTNPIMEFRSGFSYLHLDREYLHVCFLASISITCHLITLNTYH